MGEPPRSCGRPGCRGSVRDGFCDECGMAPVSGHAPTTTPATTPIATPTPATGGSSRSARTRRGRLAAGLVVVPPVPYRDPLTAIMVDPEVAEHKRFCGTCDVPVGRGHDGRPGRTDGFCPRCGTGFSFTPKLSAGDLVAGQYEVLGCLAHGGVGWAYLARDRNVNDRWVVLKGLLDTGDPDAMAAAVAERRFLATVEHPNIVRILNFVEHPNPRTGELVGYIVMEYVGGRSLKQLRAERNRDGRPRPLPLPQALAYVLEILPALGHLHGLDLLYCDFKPDNVIQTEEQLKLIDLGAVRRMDDLDGVTYKTDGYCPRELETKGPSVAADLYGVGRALAVLTFDFDFKGDYRYQLPSAAEVPLFAEHESFHRLLRRATDEDPGLRFASASEMAEQATGVLREVLAADDGRQRPALSTVFSAERDVFGADADRWPVPLRPAVVARALPVPLVDPTDRAAQFLATTSVSEPERLWSALSAAGLSTVETTLSLVRAKIEAGQAGSALADLDALTKTGNADWRITWYRGLAALSYTDYRTAWSLFDRTYDLFPGEAAPKLALAACEEFLDKPAVAARRYEVVWRTDHTYVSAAFGLARTRLLAGDRDGAVAAAESVPRSSSHHTTARLAAIRARVFGDKVTEHDLVAAGEALPALDLDAVRQACLAIEVLGAAHAWLNRNTYRAGSGGTVLGHRLRFRDLRRGLERQYRTLARHAQSKEDRVLLIERANAVRPVTWM
jgi:serine/threonine-protein kinase PknG